MIIPGGTDPCDRSGTGRQGCAWNHADRSGKVGMLSGAGTYDGRNYDCDFAADFTYEGSGGNAEPDGCPCSFLK